MTLHTDARAVLARWSAPDPTQEALRSRYVDHLDTHPDAMQRGCHPDHLTASALVVTPDATRVLLTLHRRLRRWLQTGGHCETGDDTLAAAALREATEESGITGLRVDPEPILLSHHEVPCGPVRPAHHLDVQFLAVAPARTAPVVSEESIDVAWFDADGLPETDASVRALVTAARARLALSR